MLFNRNTGEQATPEQEARAIAVANDILDNPYAAPELVARLISLKCVFGKACGKGANENAHSRPKRPERKTNMLDEKMPGWAWLLHRQNAKNLKAKRRKQRAKRRELIRQRRQSKR